MKVVITEAAEADLDTIADFIALDSPRRAVTFVRELLDAALRLGDYPTAYPLVSGYEVDAFAEGHMAIILSSMPSGTTGSLSSES